MTAAEELERWKPLTAYLVRNGHGKIEPRCWAGTEWGERSTQCSQPATSKIGLCPRHDAELVR